MYRQFHAERTSRIQNYDSAYVQNNKNTKGSGKRNKIKKYLILFISTFSRIIYKNNPSLTITILFIVALSTFSKLIFSIDERCHNNALLFQKKKKDVKRYYDL